MERIIAAMSMADIQPKALGLGSVRLANLTIVTRQLTEQSRNKVQTNRARPATA
jgi:hypothetical protein